MDTNTNAPEDQNAVQLENGPGTPTLYGPGTPTPTAVAAGGRKIDANAYFLWVDSAGGTTSFDNVVCLINFNFAGTTATNDASTMCGPDSSAGDVSSTITFNGQILLDADTGFVSAPDIFDLWENKNTIGWKIGKATPISGDMTKTGQGYFSAYGENYDNGQKGAFSGTIAVAGDITQTITP